MSKYIIEIEEKPLCVFDKDTQTYFPRLWRVKGFNSLVLDKEGLSRLDELNSDYINEHFGNLQDEAYQKGFEDGRAVCEKGCEGCEHEGKNKMANPCILCCNAYKNRWTAKQIDDKPIDIIRNGLNNWVTELGIRLEDISKILEDMKA